MIKSELELRNLIDLAFVAQDYDTTYQNAEIPIGDFKRIKAYKHAAHAEEIYFFSKMVQDRAFLTTDFKEVVSNANQIYEQYSRS